jgi:citrate lyase alpha subunit
MIEQTSIKKRVTAAIRTSSLIKQRQIADFHQSISLEGDVLLNICFQFIQKMSYKNKKFTYYYLTGIGKYG